MKNKSKGMSLKQKTYEIKRIVFSESKRIVCDNHWWCGLEDGYCFDYNCGAIRTLNQYSDKQWMNAVKQAEKECSMFANEYEFIDIVLYLLRSKKPKNRGKK